VSVRARIVELRTVADGETVSYDATWRADGPRRIATVPVGYADGYRRNLSNRGSALLRGQRVPVAGRVTMDMTMFDVTDTDAALGDIVTLLGSEGGGTITVGEMAAAAELSPYEILTGLKLRLPRRYAEEERDVAAA
jgi:alanine racemase